MSSPASGVLRLTRAAVLGAATVGLSLGAHVAAGGGAPTAVGLGLLSLPVLAVTLVATGRRLSGPAVAALLGLGQVALHIGLTALTAEPVLVGTDGSAPASAGGHHLLHLTLGTPLPAGTAGAAGGPALMTLAHLVAASLVALLLTRGEHALWSLLAWLLPRLPGAAHPPVAAGRASVGAGGALHPSRRARRRRSRAPPAALAAVLARPSRRPAGPRAALA